MEKVKCLSEFCSSAKDPTADILLEFRSAIPNVRYSEHTLS